MQSLSGPTLSANSPRCIPPSPSPTSSRRAHLSPKRRYETHLMRHFANKSFPSSRWLAARAKPSSDLRSSRLRSRELCRRQALLLRGSSSLRRHVSLTTRATTEFAAGHSRVHSFTGSRNLASLSASRDVVRRGETFFLTRMREEGEPVSVGSTKVTAIRSVLR